MTDQRDDAPSLSVVVPTRGRPDHAARCVASILECTDEQFTVTVVDQSDDDRTRDALDALDDERVRHLPTDTRGAARARNVGAAATDAPIIAFTDDDCRVDPGWIASLRAPLAEDRVGMVFGAVKKGEAPDPTAFAAEFTPHGTETYSVLPPPTEPWGISASVAVRRSVFEDVGRFDAMLGPGATINSGGEDTDLFIRVLAAGHLVVGTDATTVTHLGFRSGEEAAALNRGYAFALGAVFTKHLRLRTRPGRGQLVRWLVHFGSKTFVNVVHARRPTGAGFTLGLVKGAVHGARIPVDRSTRRFA